MRDHVGKHNRENREEEEKVDVAGDGPGCSFQRHYSVITDTYSVMRRDGTIGENELCRDLLHKCNLTLP